MPIDGSWPWRPISSSMKTNILTQQELWFSSTECPRNKEKPLLRLGSPSSKTNASLMQTRPGSRSRKPSKLHSPPMIQQHKLELPLLCSTKTGRIPQDSTNTSSSSPSSPSILESLTTTPCWNGSSEDLTHKLWYNSLSWEQLKPPPLWRNFIQRPPRLKEVTAVSHHSGGDLSDPMEEVTFTMTPMLWMWITSCYPWSNELAICTKTTVSYAIKKAVLLGIILVIIRITQQVVGTTTRNHPRPPMVMGYYHLVVLWGFRHSSAKQK